MDQIGEYFESRFQKSVENFGTGLFRVQNFSTQMYMFHFISQDALEVINWVTGCLKEPTGDCDTFGVDVLEIVALVMEVDRVAK